MRVVVVPGFGLAAAQAHHALRALDHAYGDTFAYLVHPLAGRYPGHLDLLLDLAGVPHERRLAPDHDLTGALVLAVGANDVLTYLTLPQTVVAITDGGPSFDGAQAPVLGLETTTVLRGDARAVLLSLLQPTTPYNLSPASPSPGTM